ncbi:MAG: hypothetical protein PHW58_07650 [Candidatus Methanofastidiosa archaeon]|jgi:hypothetical protein|nr:hypothetical protein [Candidatus Methanofastidiosa archaeon]MDD4282081.1 hypothetical protein [Candidatus Methanofastidiosa archaeon]
MNDIVVCPKCGFRFSRSYSRITMCNGCPHSIGHCANVKCPRCEHEFSPFDRQHPPFKE